MFKFSYLVEKPILHVDDDPRFEGNINGPSLIRVPDWVQNRLGRYYLYFAHHEGKTIRLAYADDLAGPWTVHWPGALSLADSWFPTEPTDPTMVHPEAAEMFANGTDGDYPHIASPDVIVDDVRQELRMYYHGRLPDGRQRSRIALSKDGLKWEAREPIVGYSYLRAFQHRNSWFTLAMPGFFCHSADGLEPFELGKIVFGQDMRHSALYKVGDTLHVFWTRAGDSPERILLSTVDLTGDWRDWRPDQYERAVDVHRPMKIWEGSDLPIQPSQRGGSMQPVNQLRDPAIFVEQGEIYLIYALQGEQGLGIGTLNLL